ncbi:MAG: 6-phosphogluconolactonase [Candidatus Solibacter usitatus]|nr:6-phosphogluconolactonase [Candidatus Solibacter usitatus]
MHWHTYGSAEKAAEACGNHILRRLEEAIAGDGDANIAVSGGSTPQLMFRFLAQSRFNWNHVHLFWVDERAVPPAHEDSNYRMAEECFLQPAHFPHRNVHRIQGELAPDVAAARYVEEIRSHFGLAPGELPHFDLVHLGMGADAHTASLFPGEPLIDNFDRIAAAIYVEKLERWRVTLLPGAIATAKHILFLIAGEDKAEAVRNVVEARYEPSKYPAQVISHHSRHVTWFVEQSAASLASV